MILVGYPPFFGTEEEVFSSILDGEYSLRGPRYCKDLLDEIFTHDYRILEPLSRQNSSYEFFFTVNRVEYCFASSVSFRWNRISSVGKDFVKRLLQKDPQKRLTAKDALSHVGYICDAR